MSSSSVPRRLCRYEAQGNCRYGSNCNYVHDRPSANAAAYASATYATTWKKTTENNEAAYKTTICKRWQNGGCAQGSRCPWAHGAVELRSKYKEAAKFKTAVCSHDDDECPFEEKCNFIHGAEWLIPGPFALQPALVAEL